VYNSITCDCLSKLRLPKKVAKKKKQKKTSQEHLKLDMTSGIITADDPFIALWGQEGV